MTRIKYFVAMPLTLVALVVGTGCVSDSSVISSAADAHTQLEPAIIVDADLAAYTQRVGDRVVAAAREMVQNEGFEHDRIYKQDPSWMFENVQFHLVSSDTLNAFTTGGTHVYLYSELFQTTKTEDEFAAVVAHEFAHIVGRHVARGTRQQYAILGAAALAGIGGYALGGDNREELAATLAGGTATAGQFIGMGFTRDDEAEADKFGFQFYCNAGWDPDQFGGFFQTLIDKGLDGDSEAASDHPLLKNRVAAAKQWAQEWKQEHPNWESMRQPNIASGSQYRGLQRETEVADRAMPKDDSLAAAELMLSAFPSCVAPTDQQSQVDARNELTQIAEEQQDPSMDAKPKKSKAQRKRERADQ